MPEARYEVRVSRREGDRPRLMQAVVLQPPGAARAVHLMLVVDELGSFDIDAPIRRRDVYVEPDRTSIYFQWYAWPRGAPQNDFCSCVCAYWEDETAIVYLEDLYE